MLMGDETVSSSTGDQPGPSGKSVETKVRRGSYASSSKYDDRRSVEAQGPVGLAAETVRSSSKEKLDVGEQASARRSYAMSMNAHREISRSGARNPSSPTVPKDVTSDLNEAPCPSENVSNEEGYYDPYYYPYAQYDKSSSYYGSSHINPEYYRYYDPRYVTDSGQPVEYCQEYCCNPMLEETYEGYRDSYCHGGECCDPTQPMSMDYRNYFVKKSKLKYGQGRYYDEEEIPEASRGSEGREMGESTKEGEQQNTNTYNQSRYPSDNVASAERWSNEPKPSGKPKLSGRSSQEGTSVWDYQNYPEPEGIRELIETDQSSSANVQNRHQEGYIQNNESQSYCQSIDIQTQHSSPWNYAPGLSNVIGSSVETAEAHTILTPAEAVDCEEPPGWDYEDYIAATCDRAELFKVLSSSAWAPKTDFTNWKEPKHRFVPKKKFWPKQQNQRPGLGSRSQFGRKKRSKFPPWYTEEMKRLKLEYRRAFKRYKKDKNPERRKKKLLEYRAARTLLQRAIRQDRGNERDCGLESTNTIQEEVKLLRAPLKVQGTKESSKGVTQEKINDIQNEMKMQEGDKGSKGAILELINEIRNEVKTQKGDKAGKGAIQEKINEIQKEIKTQKVNKALNISNYESNKGEKRGAQVITKKVEKGKETNAENEDNTGCESVSLFEVVEADKEIDTMKVNKTISPKFIQQNTNTALNKPLREDGDMTVEITGMTVGVGNIVRKDGELCQTQIETIAHVLVADSSTGEGKTVEREYSERTTTNPNLLEGIENCSLSKENPKQVNESCIIEREVVKMTEAHEGVMETRESNFGVVPFATDRNRKTGVSTKSVMDKQADNSLEEMNSEESRVVDVKGKLVTEEVKGTLEYEIKEKVDRIVEVEKREYVSSQEKEFSVDKEAIGSVVAVEDKCDSDSVKEKLVGKEEVHLGSSKGKYVELKEEHETSSDLKLKSKEESDMKQGQPEVSVSSEVGESTATQRKESASDNEGAIEMEVVTKNQTVHKGTKRKSVADRTPVSKKPLVSEEMTEQAGPSSSKKGEKKLPSAIEEMKDYLMRHKMKFVKGSDEELTSVSPRKSARLSEKPRVKFSRWK